jgi:TP901 family phage tail tape measure protein
MINIGTLVGVLQLQNNMGPVIAQATTMLAGMNQTMEMSVGQLRTLGLSAGLTAPQINSLGEALELSTQQLTVLNRPLQITTAQLNSLTATAERSAYQMTLLGRGMSEAGMLMSGITVALFAVVKGVIEVGSEFETQMTRVVTLAGASRSQVDGMRESVLKLAGETAVAPAELARGLYVLMSTGRSTGEAMETLRVSAEMTALGMGNMHDTTLAITGAMFAYKDSNLTAADAANTLIKAVQLGNMEIQDLVPAIARVNPIAAALGVSFQDVAAGIATFTHAGVDSAVAATGMRAMLNNILTDSAKTEKGFAQLSKELNNSSISMANFRQKMKDDGFTAAMIDLMDKVKKAGDVGVSAIGKIFPNIRALTEALFVYKTNGDLVVDMLKRFNDGQDVLRSGTTELQKTWKWQWEQMKVSVDKLWISLSTSLLPLFKNLLGAFELTATVVGGVIRAFNALPQWIQAVVVSILGLIGTVGPLLLFFGQIEMAIGNIARGLVALDVISKPQAFISFLKNPYLLGAAAVLIAISTALMLVSNGTQKVTETSSKAIDAHLKQLSALEGLQRQVNSSNVSLDEQKKIVEALIAVSPTSVLEIQKQSKSYEGLKKAIADAINTEKEELAVRAISLQADIAQLEFNKKKADEATRQAAIQLDASKNAERISSYAAAAATGAIPATARTTQEVSKMSEAWKKAGEESKKYDQELNTAKQTLEIVGHAINGTLDSFLKEKQVTEAATVAAKQHTEHVNAQTDAYEKSKRMIDNLEAGIKDLTEADKKAIANFQKAGLDPKAIAAEIHVGQEVIEYYINGVKKAAPEINKLAKEHEKQASALGRVNELLKDQGGRAGKTTEEWVKLALAANYSISDLAKASKIPEATLQVWRREIIATTEAEKKLASDTEKSMNQTSVLIADTLARQKTASGETYAGMMADVETWKTAQINALNKLSLDWETYEDHYTAILNNAQARRDEINAKQKEKQEKLLESLNIINEKWESDNLALHIRYAGLRNSLDDNSYVMRLAKIKEWEEKELGENQKRLNVALKQIEDNHSLELDEQTIQNKKLEDKAKDAANTITGISTELQKQLKKTTFKDITSEIGKFVSSLKGDFAKGIGSAIQLSDDLSNALLNLEKAFTKVDNKTGGTSTKLSDPKALISGAVGVISALMSILQQTGSEGMNALNGAISGAMSGSVFGLAGAAFGAFAGMIAGFMAKTNDSAKQLQEHLKQIAWDVSHDFGEEVKVGLINGVRGINISEALAQQIDDSMKKIAQLLPGSGMSAATRQIAEALNLGSIIDENPLDPTNYEKFALTLTNLQRAFEQGAIGFTDYKNALETSFGKFAEYINRTGTLASTALLQVMKDQEAAAVYSDEVFKFIQTQADKVISGFNSIAKGIYQPILDAYEKIESGSDKTFTKIPDYTKVTQAEFDRIGRLGVAAFGAALKSGKNFLEAVDSIGSSLDGLAKLMDKTGLKSSGMFAQLLGIRKWAEANRDVADSVSGINDMLVGMHNAGIMDQSLFTDLSATAYDMFMKIQAQGLTANQAMLVMQPSLQTLWELEQDFGYQVDAATQAMIDQAVQAGVVGDKQRSAADRAALSLEKVVNILSSMATAMGITIPNAAASMVDGINWELYRLPSSIDIPVRIEIPDTTGAGLPPGAIPLSDGFGFSGGTHGQFIDFGAGTPVTLHGKERVVTESEGSSVSGNVTLSAPVTVNLTVQAIDTQDLKTRGVREIAPAIFEAIKRGQFGLRTIAQDALK